VHIYDTPTGFDYDLALLRELLVLLDSQLDRIDTDSQDSERDEYSYLYERSDHVIGLGLVACQTYLAARSGWVGLKKCQTLDLGPFHPCGRSIASIINAAANYWKHAPEEGGFHVTPKTLASLTAVGVDGSDFIVSQALDGLLGRSGARLIETVPLLVAWRHAIGECEI
jgi:hypothetical protein